MLGPEACGWLADQCGSAVRFDEPMARHTSFRIGGPADALVEPPDETSLLKIVSWARREDIPFIVLGGGTNLLVCDGGIRGLVITLNRAVTGVEWSVDQTTVQISAGAGVSTRRLCALALRHGWAGLNFALGIPGRLGGALLMNAGTQSGCMGDILSSITLFNAEGQLIRIAGATITRGYRQLCLPASVGASPVVVRAGLTLKTADRNQVYADAVRRIRRRVARQPVGWPNAGCFFKNPSPQISAGRLIDEAGLKGLTVGRAQVSPVHANFIVNLGGATATEVLALADNIQTTVWRSSRIWLEPEVRIVGENAQA